jgi:predicted nucleic acid-binding protein
MVILDSNIWIARFDADDQTHEKAEKIFAEFDLRDIVVTEYIVLEVTTILKQKKEHVLAERFLDFLEDFDMVVLESEEFYTKTKRKFRMLQKNHLSFVDVSLLALSEEYEVVTLDKHLKKLLKH